MKSIGSMAAALTLTAYALPAAAFAASPVVQLVALGPAHVATVSQRAGCDAPAAVDGTPFLEVPAIAAGQGVTGTAQVKIRLTASGALAGEELFASSGNPWLDSAALLSARMSRYSAESINCERVAGSYLYEVDF